MKNRERGEEKKMEKKKTFQNTSKINNSIDSSKYGDMSNQK